MHRFSRTKPRETALAYMRGLIAPLERKNGWTLAEQAGHAAPDRIHRLLNQIDWALMRSWTTYATTSWNTSETRAPS